MNIANTARSLPLITSSKIVQKKFLCFTWNKRLVFTTTSKQIYSVAIKTSNAASLQNECLLVESKQLCVELKHSGNPGDELITEMLDADPCQRISAEQCLKKLDILLASKDFI
ncbi:hypothetical protein PHSC3_000665 [Chlamydiales bacterium STE3]|nr:hypothetical protein PHSC3_000665 [Chlamydiales bacterium STE3]